MAGIPTVLVAGVLWTVSRRWYSRKTARIGTIAVSTVSLLVYAGTAFLVTWPFL